MFISCEHKNNYHLNKGLSTSDRAVTLNPTLRTSKWADLGADHLYTSHVYNFNNKNGGYSAAVTVSNNPAHNIHCKNDIVNITGNS